MSEAYVPSDESLKFIAFIRAAGIEENANAELHYKLADKYFSSDKRIVIESFRGSAKSTLMEWLVIYTAVLGFLPKFGECPFIAFVGDSAENGVKNFFRNLDAKIDQSAFLRSLLKVKRKTDAEMELVNTNNVELYLKGFGAGTNIRGVRYNNYRPSVVILDDITTNDALNSEAIQNTINNNFYKSITPAMHPTKFKMFFIGTPISENDLLHQLSKNKNWTVHKFPIAEKFPCTRKEFIGAWPDRFPYETVKEQYETMKESGKAQDFFQEYMLELTDLTTLLVDEEDIRWYEPQMFNKNKHLYNFYISTDFAVSQKKSADFSTIGVWAVGSNDTWFLVDGQCKRQGMQENLDDLFRYVNKWKPLSVGIETSGQQGGFLSIIDEMMMAKNIWFNLAKKPNSKDRGIRPATDKTTRFVTGVQPKFKQNKIWLPKIELIKDKPFLFELMEELLNELSKYTLAGGHKALAHDDCVAGDTLVSMSNGTYKKISDVEIGDEILTFDIDMLAQPVKAVMMTGIKEVNTYVFSDGSELTMSDKHPVLTTVGYIPAALLLPEDEVISWNNTTIKNVGGVKNQLQLDSLTGLPIVTVHANFKQYKQTLLDRENSLANGAEVHFCGIEKNQAVAKNANLISLCEKKDKRLIPTFNLEVANTHNFIANGIVVHNCLDLLNQLSEMELYSPAEGLSEEGMTVVTKEGEIWTSLDTRTDFDGYEARSTIF